MYVCMFLSLSLYIYIYTSMCNIIIYAAPQPRPRSQHLLHAGQHREARAPGPQPYDIISYHNTL